MVAPTYRFDTIVAFAPNGAPQLAPGFLIMYARGPHSNYLNNASGVLDLIFGHASIRFEQRAASLSFPPMALALGTHTRGQLAADIADHVRDHLQGHDIALFERIRLVDVRQGANGIWTVSLDI
ncbi:hypothetical protein PsYK624_091250 [Phanerochaete sordida]|uniref:Uncharacterized protein n=1 Tax=Phanerochaete sordida TaxID=48140 RepID=A0A9P3LEX0_9APHY|nr:hypothetical protein PsYK624_091250 [Phanerochaete sordida]